MNKKISSEEILLAIGDLPCELLSVSPPVSRRKRNIRTLSIAAAIALFVGVLSPIIIGGMAKSFDKVGGNMAPSKGEAADGTNREDMESGINAPCLIIDADGNILDQSVLDGGRLYTSFGMATIGISHNDYSGISLYIRGEESELIPSDVNNSYVFFDIPVKDVTKLDAKSADGKMLFTVILTADGDFADIEILHISETDDLPET